MPKKQTKNNLTEDFGSDNDQSFVHYRFSQNQSQTTASRSKNWVYNNKVKIIIVLIVLLFGGWGVKNYLDLKVANQKLEGFKENPTASSQEEAKKIVEAVAKLVILPDGEQPTVATVTDPSKLADQPFFANSQAGDKVLIYENAQRAILYRPSSNKVIEIAPLNLGGSNSVVDVVNQTKNNDQSTDQVNSNKSSNSNKSGNSNSNSSNSNEE